LSHYLFIYFFVVHREIPIKGIFLPSLKGVQVCQFFPFLLLIFQFISLNDPVSYEFRFYDRANISICQPQLPDEVDDKSSMKLLKGSKITLLALWYPDRLLIESDASVAPFSIQFECINSDKVLEFIVLLGKTLNYSFDISLMNERGIEMAYYRPFHHNLSLLASIYSPVQGLDSSKISSKNMFYMLGKRILPFCVFKKYTCIQIMKQWKLVWSTIRSSS
jgi:hypothetical protein